MILVLQYTFRQKMIKQSATHLPTKWGNFKIIAYADSANEKSPHFAMVHESHQDKQSVLVRIHSECLTGDLFGSKRCDCGEQLDTALKMAAEQGGIVIYLRQEGRGIGIINKLKAYNLQDQGLDTIEANVHLGLDIDSRKYAEAIYILEDLKVESIRLLTNNPLKIEAIDQSKIILENRVSLIIPAQLENEKYLKTKQDAMGHLLNGKH